MWKFIFIFFLFVHVVSSLCAQGKIEVRGKITDSSGVGLSKATVTIVTSTDTLTLLSRDEGSFDFTAFATDSLELRITIKGFEGVRKVVAVPSGTSRMVLPVIVLKSVYGELKPVMVMAKRVAKVAEDTIEYFSNAFDFHKGDQLEFLLKRFPGLQINADGSIAFEGKKVSKIMINGRDFVGGDLAVAIRSLPADIIERIQFIDDYGDKGRLTGVHSGEADKTINLVLKQENQNGEFGKIETGAGDKSKYIASVFSDIITKQQQITLNAWVRDTTPIGNDHERGVYFGYSDQFDRKWSGSGNLGFWGNNSSAQSNISQSEILPASLLQLQQNTSELGKIDNSALIYTLEFRPNQSSMIRISPSFQISKSSTVISGNSLSFETDSNFHKTTNADIVDTAFKRNKSIGSELYFEKVFGSGARLSLTGSISHSNRDQWEDQTQNTAVQTDTGENRSDYRYLPHLADFKNDLSVKLSYYFPFGKGSFVEIAYAGHFLFEQSERETETFDSSVLHLVDIDSLSNNYFFKSASHRIHAGYLTHVGKLNINFGLEGQPATLKGQVPGKIVLSDSRYFNLSPVASLTWNPATGRKYSLDYSGGFQFPQVAQLQPVTDLSNPQYPVTGNPFLKPAYLHTAIFRYENIPKQPHSHLAFGIVLKYTSTQDMVVRNIVHSNDTGIIIERTNYANVNGFHSFMSAYHAEMPSIFHNRFHMSAFGAFTGNRLVSLLDDNLYHTTNFSMSQGLRLSFILPEITENYLSCKYAYSRTIYDGQSSISSFSSVEWDFQSRYFLSSRTVCEMNMSQFFGSNSFGGLQPSPAIVNTSVRHRLRRNPVSACLSVFNLLNSGSRMNQLVTPVSITKTNEALTGRYFLVGLSLNFERFKKNNPGF